MPQLLPQPCITVCFLKLLGLTHASALTHIYSRDDSRMQSIVSHLLTMLQIEKGQPEQDWFSQHSWVVTWSHSISCAPLARHITIFSWQGVSHSDPDCTTLFSSVRLLKMHYYRKLCFQPSACITLIW